MKRHDVPQVGDIIIQVIIIIEAQFFPTPLVVISIVALVTLSTIIVGFKDDDSSTIK